ncbi:MAG TPA: cbb3-type cytochrome c oxidase subunit I [Woeseiaceae bacterium]|nr:cbb3-type cytochrome c oxidase subunit I [Woeseiaceae bacterium]
MTTVAEHEPSIRRATLVWEATALAMFLVLACLGLAMWAAQGDLAAFSPPRFYSFMTLHGLGMSGAMFISSLAAVRYLLSTRYGITVRGLWGVYGLVLLGVVGLIAATVIGRFAPGWYLLYPMALVNATWPGWATPLALTGLVTLGTGWLVFQLLLLAGLGRRYGFRNLLGWQYFRKGPVEVEIPPIALITTVSLIAGVLTVIVGAVFLAFNLVDWYTGRTAFDPLLMKNMVFLFGHTVVNVTMYLGIAAVYELMPEYSGRSWPTNRAVVLSWNAALILVIFAYLHHQYMDFVQPASFQYLGQIASYGSAVPATVITVFGLIAQIYRSGLRWDFVPLTFLLGIVGWVIGGFAAVVDSTIAVNLSFHNTLWVPGHFHTYFLVGYLLLLFGIVYRLTRSPAEKAGKTALALMVTGGYGFVLMFYVGGALGVPRRYATYQIVPLDNIKQVGTVTAELAAAFAVLFLFGFLVYLATLLAHRPAAETA